MGLIVFIAYWQLKKIRKNNSISIVLNLEKELRQSGRNLRQITNQMYEKLRLESLKEGELIDIKGTLIQEFGIFYDILDKIAFCILNKYMSGKALEKEYRGIIIKAVEEGNPDHEVNDNLYRLYNKFVKGGKKRKQE